MPKQQKQAAPTPGAALRNAFAPSALKFAQRSVDLGDQWGRVYYVSDFPPSVDAGWLANAANLDGVVLSIHALPTDPTQLTLAMSRAISLLAGQLSTKATALAAQRAEQQLQDAQALLRKIDAEQQSVFTVGVVLMVTAPDEATGLRRAKRLEGMLAAAGMRARPLAFRQEEGLKAVGPWGIFPESLKGGAPFQLPAETLAAAFPFSSGGINHGHGIVLGHDSSGGLILFDRWIPPADAGISNRNMVILAGSGAGKSHTTKVALLREFAQGARIVILDPEREYRHLAKALGGAWVNVGGGGTRINPLQAPPVPDIDQEDEDAGSTQPIARHMQRVRLFLQLYLPQLGQQQQAAIGRALRAVYAAKGIALDADPASIPAEAWPNIADVYRHLLAQRDDSVAQSVAALLEEAAVGADAQLWAGPSTVDVGSAQLVVLDIHDLAESPPNLQRAQYQNVLAFAWDLVRQSRSERTILVADEAWLMVDPRAPEALGFLRAMSKRVRKYDGSLWTITQNAVDFLAPEVAREGEPVLANSSMVLLLRQEAKDLPTVTQLYSLSEAEQERLRTARVGEGLLIAGNHRAWVTIDTAPHETAIMYGGGK